MDILAISYRKLRVDPRHRRLIEFFGRDPDNRLHRLSVTAEPADTQCQVIRLRVPSKVSRALSLYFRAPARRYNEVVEKPLANALSKVSNPDLILIADIDVLPSLNLLRSRFPEALFVVDLYENYLDFQGKSHLARYYSFLLEEGLAQLTERDILCTPEHNTASMYQDYLGHPVLTVPNARLRSEYTTPANLPDSSNRALKLVHTGFLFTNRGIKTYVSALRMAPSNLCLTIHTPSSPMRRLIVRLSNLDLVLRRKLSIRRAVSYTRLVDTISRFDYGLCLIEGENANAKYALPNKFFDYVAAGIPMALGTGPVLTQFAEQLRQDSLTKSDPHELACLLSQLDADKLETMRSELAARRAPLSSDQSLERLYDKIRDV